MYGYIKLFRINQYFMKTSDHVHRISYKYIIFRHYLFRNHSFLINDKLNHHQYPPPWGKVVQCPQMLAISLFVARVFTFHFFPAAFSLTVLFHVVFGLQLFRVPVYVSQPHSNTVCYTAMQFIFKNLSFNLHFSFSTLGSALSSSEVIKVVHFSY